MLFELFFAGIVTIALPVRAWRRYCRRAPPAPPAHYIPETLLLIGLLSALLWRHQVPLEALGLLTDFSVRWLRDLVICLAVIVAPDIWIVWRVTRSSLKTSPLPTSQGFAADTLRGGRAGASFMTVTIVGAVWEELCFRGAVFAFVPQTPGSLIVGVVVGSIAFGAQHLRNGCSGMIYSTVFGIVFACLFVATGNLWAVMIAHAAGNLLTVWQWAPRIEQARQRSLRQRPMFLG